MFAIVFFISAVLCAGLFYYGYYYLCWAGWCEDVAFACMLIAFLWLVALMC